MKLSHHEDQIHAEREGWLGSVVNSLKQNRYIS